MTPAEPDWLFGRRFTATEREDRLTAIGEAAGMRLPKGLLRYIWPRPFEADGCLTRCMFPTKADGRLPLGWITFEGQERKVVELAIEAATGIPIERPWRTIPHHCGVHGCCNPHHWTVDVRDTDIPPARLLHGPMAGFHRGYHTADAELLASLIMRMGDWRTTHTAILQSRLSYYPLALVELAHKLATARHERDSTNSAGST